MRRAILVAVVFCCFSVCFSVIPMNGFAQNQSDGGAAIRLKKAHVVRYYENCISQHRSDAECRVELKALHPREKAALQKILRNGQKYNEYEVSKAMAACYDPTHDYKDLIECWERLAAKLVAGADLR